MYRRIIALLLVMLVMTTASAQVRGRQRPRVDRQKILVWNVSLTSLFTLISAVVQRQVESPQDALHHFLIGSAAGFSYYEAKRIAGKGRAAQAWLLTNATATIVENTSSGEHPLGRIGYTVGPLRLRVATRWTRTAVARVEADWSLAETAALGRALLEGDDVRWRDGLIAIDRDEPWPDPDREGHTFTGRAFGVFPGVAPGAHPKVWPHETIHVIQSQQLDSVEPPLYSFGGDREDDKPLRLFMFRHVRLGFTHLANYPTFERPYGERWGEVEAYGLAEGTPVDIR